MGDSFDVVGVVELASTGRSLKIVIGSETIGYVGLKALCNVINRHKKTATIYLLKEVERSSPRF